jgi:hypothetical protein
MYIDIEDRLTDLLGVEDTLVLPTITHIHMSVIPAIAGRGDIFLDGQAHRTIYDGCMVARGHGATLRRYPTGDVEALDVMLRAAPKGNTKLICTDGVNSMTGNPPIWRHSPLSLATTMRSYTSMTHTVSASSVSAATPRPAPMGAEVTRWSDMSARPTTTSSWSAVSLSHTPHCWPS